MTRVVKKHQERRSEIIQTAGALIQKMGYDSTSVNLIIATIGISKGTFYHYFKSKEDLLDALIEQFVADTLKEIEPVIARTDLDAISKMNLFYKRGGMYKVENMDRLNTIVAAMYDPKNLLLRHKLNKRTVELTLPTRTRSLHLRYRAWLKLRQRRKIALTDQQDQCCQTIEEGVKKKLNQN